MNNAITPADARHEIARRKLDKADAAYQDRGPAWQLSGKELAALAAKRTTRKAPAAKPAPKPAEVSPHKALRDLAWQMRCDAKAAGEKLTYEQACALLGTTPARKAA